MGPPLDLAAEKTPIPWHPDCSIAGMNHRILALILSLLSSVSYAQTPEGGLRRGNTVADAILILFGLEAPSDSAEAIPLESPVGRVLEEIARSLNADPAVAPLDSALIEEFRASRAFRALALSLGLAEANRFIEQASQGATADALIEEFVPESERMGARMRIMQAVEGSMPREASATRLRRQEGGDRPTPGERSRPVARVGAA